MNDLLLVNLISLLKKSRFVTFELMDFENADEEVNMLQKNFNEFDLTDIQHKYEYGQVTIKVGILPEHTGRYDYESKED